MKLTVKILIGLFVFVLLVEFLNTEPTVYDCRDKDSYSQYPEWVIRECIKQYRTRPGLIT